MRVFFGDTINLVLLGVGLSGLGVVLLFVQRGIIYNLIQFFQHFVLVFGFFAAVAVIEISKKIEGRRLKITLAAILIIFSVPTVIGNLVDFYGKDRTPLAIIDNQEIEALFYLKQNSPPEALVLTQPFDENAHWSFDKQPWPISVWYSTGYVSALASRRTYLTSEEQAGLFGLPVARRKEEVLGFFAGKDGKEFLSQRGVDYLYLLKREIKTPLDEKTLGLTRFFENDEVIIYKAI